MHSPVTTQNISQAREIWSYWFCRPDQLARNLWVISFLFFFLWKIPAHIQINENWSEGLEQLFERAYLSALVSRELGKIRCEKLTAVKIPKSTQLSRSFRLFFYTWSFSPFELSFSVSFMLGYGCAAPHEWKFHEPNLRYTKSLADSTYAVGLHLWQIHDVMASPLWIWCERQTPVNGAGKLHTWMFRRSFQNRKL